MDKPRKFANVCEFALLCNNPSTGATAKGHFLCSYGRCLSWTPDELDTIHDAVWWKNIITKPRESTFCPYMKWKATVTATEQDSRSQRTAVFCK